MWSPGAATLTHDPNSEYEASVSVESVAATERTLSHAPGYSGVETPLLPAAATTTTPLPQAYWTASFRMVEESELPRLMLITFAPWSAAHLIPSTTWESLPDPVESRT